MKAIVLTYAPITEEEKELLKGTDIYKIACNNYCADLKPDIRLTADDIVDKCLAADNCEVVSLNFDLGKDRVINACYLPKRHSSLLSCIDYLSLKGFNQILLVASNPPSATEKINFEGVNILNEYLYLYKYTENGNFNIPYKSIKDFIMLTDEEKIFGVVETPQKKYFASTVFTDACEYEVSTVGKDNKSIESGLLVANLLPFEEKQKFINGETEIIYNDIKIKRLTELLPVVEPEKQEEIEEVKEEKEIIEKKPVKKTVKKATTKKKARK